MRIELDSVLPFPRDVVFTAYRDDMSAFARYLPNVRAIDVVSRHESGDEVRIHNVWHGATELPAALAQSLEARFLSWDDDALWNHAEHSCAWTILPRAFQQAVRCEGHMRFIALGEEKTRMDLTGELSIELDQRGIPDFLTGSLARVAERFVMRQLTLNLESMAQAIQSYLTEDTVV